MAAGGFVSGAENHLSLARWCVGMLGGRVGVVAENGDGRLEKV